MCVCICTPVLFSGVFRWVLGLLFLHLLIYKCCTQSPLFEERFSSQVCQIHSFDLLHVTFSPCISACLHASFLLPVMELGRLLIFLSTCLSVDLSVHRANMRLWSFSSVPVPTLPMPGQAEPSCGIFGF